MRNEKDLQFLSLFDVPRVDERGRLGLNLPTLVAFVLLVALLAGDVWLNHWHTRLLYGEQRFVTHTHEVIGQVRSVLTSLLDAQAVARGYLITGSEEHLETYQEAVSLVEEHIAGLSRLTVDDERQRPLVKALEARVRAKIAYIDRFVALERVDRLAEAARILPTREGESLMDEVRTTIAEIEANEEALLVEREASAQSSYRTAQTTGLSVGIAGLFLVVVLYTVVGRFDRLRSRAIREISAAREGFRVALASIGDAVLVTDSEGRLAFCNEGCRSILRVGPEDLGRPIDDLITPIAESSGELREFIVHRARSEGGIQRTGADAAIRLHDGSWIPIDATAASIPGQDGESRGVILVIRDATERRERERELARSNKRFSSLVLATSQIVWTADASGLVREDSPSWRHVTGQTYEEWKGHGWIEALHPDDRNRVLHGWKEAVAEKRPYFVECRLHTAGGSYRWNMVRVVPVVDPDGVREWVGMSHDIQSRKDAEDGLSEASRHKDEFIALLAHELRNPLAPLRNGLEILKSGASSDAPHALEMMDRQVLHMVRLIDDLLDVSRIRAGKLELRRERLDLREILGQSVEVVRSALQAKNQHLGVSLPNAPMWVDGDPVRLTQVVINLLSNAGKYSDDEADIWLTAEREGTRHVVRVRDTGQGIPTEIQPRIWDLFLQGGCRTDRVEGGLGIGLTLVRRLVELHNGTVDVHSDGIGTGSEFIVRLPVAAVPLGSTPEVPAPVRLAARPLRILVIDDNEDSAVSLSMLLRVGGHAVRVAFQGEAGLLQFARFDPDLVLCDIRMPDLSGHEVARRLRALPNGQGTLLVALTGFGTWADREASARAGFDRHIVKPVDPNVLAEVVREAGMRCAEPPGEGARV